MLHLLVHRAVGEAAPADADALQHAVASQLMQHQSEDRYIDVGFAKLQVTRRSEHNRPAADKVQ